VRGLAELGDDRKGSRKRVQQTSKKKKKIAEKGREPRKWELKYTFEPEAWRDRGRGP